MSFISHVKVVVSVWKRHCIWSYSPYQEGNVKYKNKSLTWELFFGSKWFKWQRFLSTFYWVMIYNKGTVKLISPGALLNTLTSIDRGLKDTGYPSMKIAYILFFRFLSWMT